MTDIYPGLRRAATLCLDYDHGTSPAYRAILRAMAGELCTACTRGFIVDLKDRSVPCEHPGIDPWGVAQPAVAPGPLPGQFDLFAEVS